MTDVNILAQRFQTSSRGSWSDKHESSFQSWVPSLCFAHWNTFPASLLLSILKCPKNTEKNKYDELKSQCEWFVALQINTAYTINMLELFPGTKYHGKPLMCVEALLSSSCSANNQLGWPKASCLTSPWLDPSPLNQNLQSMINPQDFIIFLFLLLLIFTPDVPCASKTSLTPTHIVRSASLPPYLTLSGNTVPLQTLPLLPKTFSWLKAAMNMVHRIKWIKKRFQLNCIWLDVHHLPVFS